jgi:hypothetical protein
MRAITYRTFELRRRDKNTRIVEIFGPACGDLALSTAASVAAAKRWIDGYIDLERTIADLIDRKSAAPEDSAERQLLQRQLINLRYSYEEAGGIIEDLDRDWGVIARPLAASPSTEPRQVLPFRKPGSRDGPGRA